MLDRAKFLLVSEIAEVEGKTARHRSRRRSTRPSASTLQPDGKVGKKPVQKPVGAGRRASDA